MEFIDFDDLKDCRSLSKVSIPSSVTSIFSYFTDCTRLISIEVDKDNPNYSSYDGVLYNKDKTEFIVFPKHKYSFDIALGMPNGRDCEIPVNVNNISHIGFPESMNKVSSNYYKSYSLTDITLPETIWLKDGYDSPFNRFSDGDIPVMHGKKGTGAELQAYDMGFYFKPFSDEEIRDRKNNVKEWKRSKSLLSSDKKYYYNKLESDKAVITSFEPTNKEDLIIPETI